MDRRTFIRLSGTAAAVSVAPWLTACTSNSKWTITLSTPQTLGLFCGKDELMAIGQQYRKDFPQEGGKSTLEGLLLAEKDGKVFGASSEAAVHDFLKEKITHEFRSGDLGIVRGWVLARTEARQLALYSILNS